MSLENAYQQGFTVQVLEDYESISREAGEQVIRRLKEKPDLILCASTGGSPTGMYAYLVARGKAEPKLFERMRVLQIDEWGGLPAGHSATCKADLEQKLTGPLGIRGERFISLDTETRTPEGEALRAGTWVRENGPIDICVLGLGLNGHIAMNEPAEVLSPRAHVATLAKSSLQHGMLRDVARKPGWGLTMGMADILNSREVLLLVNGEAKRPAVCRLMEGKITTQFPASFLWMHGAARMLCDKFAYGIPSTTA